MAKDIQDSITFLEEAKAALTEIEILRGRLGRAQAEEKRISKILTNEKRSMEENISATIAKRKEEITVSYDKEITKSQDKLKKVRSRRDRAKEKGVKARMQKDTADLREDNRQLHEANITSLRKDKLPSLCDSKLYMSLFFPKHIAEYLIVALAFLLCFVAIPCGIFMIQPKHTPFAMAAIYIVDILVMWILYIGLNNRTKVAHLTTLNEIRKNRDMIDTNLKKIRAIKKSIEKDKDENIYKLDKYDDEISVAESELEEVAKKKQNILTTFEQVTQHELEQEIRDNNAEKLEKLSQQVKDLTTRVQGLTDEIQEKNLVFTDDYGQYISREFMSPDKLEKLAEILRQDLASSISEAQEIFKDVK